LKEIVRKARAARGLRSYVIKTCRRIIGPGGEPKAPPVWALRRIFGDYLQVTADGHPFIVDLRDTVVSYGIVADGAWEEEETALIRRLIKPGDHVVDVGAHIGYHAVIFAAAVGSRGKVLAFEPAGDNADLLEINVALNGFEKVVEVLRAAAGSKPATVHLVRDHGQAETARGVSNRGAHHVAPVNGADAPLVQLTTVDDATAGWERVDAVKIDVEGYEWHVLQGMRQTLARNIDLVLFVEFWPAAIVRAGAEPAALLDELETQGFSLWEIRRPGGLERYERGALLKRLSGATDLVDLLCVRGAKTAGLG